VCALYRPALTQAHRLHATGLHSYQQQLQNNLLYLASVADHKIVPGVLVHKRKPPEPTNVPDSATMQLPDPTHITEQQLPPHPMAAIAHTTTAPMPHAMAVASTNRSADSGASAKYRQWTAEEEARFLEVCDRPLTHRQMAAHIRTKTAAQVRYHLVKYAEARNRTQAT
jgi:hypothetical protein